jgi:hypothetical protein
MTRQEPFQFGGIAHDALLSLRYNNRPLLPNFKFFALFQDIQNVMGQNQRWPIVMNDERSSNIVK